MGFPFQRASKAARVAAGNAEGAIELLTSGVKGLSHAQCHPAMESCRTPGHATWSAGCQFDRLTAPWLCLQASLMMRASQR